MRKINAQTIEDLVFRNPKVRRLLWKKYERYFKEYLFLSQIGIDKAVIQKVFIRFLSEFQKKEDQAELISCLGGGFEFEAERSNLVFEVEILRTTNNLGLNQSNLELNQSNLGLNQSNLGLTTNNLGLITNFTGGTDFRLALTSRNFSEKKHENDVLTKNVESASLEQDLNNVHRIYPNYFLSRSKDKVRLNFWK
jgi:hypothetical protein